MFLSLARTIWMKWSTRSALTPGRAGSVIVCAVRRLCPELCLPQHYAYTFNEQIAQFASCRNMLEHVQFTRMQMHVPYPNGATVTGIDICICSNNVWHQLEMTLNRSNLIHVTTFCRNLVVAATCLCNVQCWEENKQWKLGRNENERQIIQR